MDFVDDCVDDDFLDADDDLETVTRRERPTRPSEAQTLVTRTDADRGMKASRSCRFQSDMVIRFRGW